ncbi:Hypothetical protein ETA_pET490450 (plasmid) [Erwinia tasmaniensis Et1/99]|uniref:Uncharacterized protein n=1 Tax=Erwinia tasmaniensis (strain DSM 17950 / CFBP 7177 / CIP 109463 / NCPPB 4357 / Et1/99) TaxID=465817 RepID=B2VAW7_ERWT9|nr:Hypothetical protein ETA_pET490450 [Erwinia tasmaniensis Et1/99]
MAPAPAAPQRRWPASRTVATAPDILNKIPARAAVRSPCASSLTLRLVPGPGLPSFIPQAIRHSGHSVQPPSRHLIVTTFIILIAISGADLQPPRPYPRLISTTGRSCRPLPPGSRHTPPRQNGTIGRNVQYLF